MTAKYISIYQDSNLRVVFVVLYCADIMEQPVLRRSEQVNYIS